MNPIQALQQLQHRLLNRTAQGVTRSRSAWGSFRLGIAARLGIAFLGVVVLVLAANFLVVRVVSLVTTTTIYTAPPPKIEKPAIVKSQPPVVARRIDTGELQSAVSHYRSAVRGRVEAQSARSLAEQTAASSELERAVALLDSQAKAIGRTSETARVNALVSGYRTDSDAVIALADDRRDAVHRYEASAEGVRAEAKRSLDRSWKIFGLVITRQALLQYNAALDDLIGDDTDPTQLPGSAAAVVRAQKILEANAAGFRRTLGAAWYSDQQEGLGRLQTLRATLQDLAAQLTARTSHNLELVDSLVRSIPRQLVEDLPQATAAAVRARPTTAALSPAANPSGEPAIAQAPAPVTTQSVDYHRDENGRRQALIVWISVCIAALLGVLGAGTVHSIERPVRRLLQATSRIAKGEASVRVTRGGIKELDTLAVAFNSMADELTQARALALEYQQSLEQKVDERTRQLKDFAENDYLTGLPNRRQFLTFLHAALERAQSAGRLVGVLFLDVDNFKYLNDSLGHAFGDRVLVSLANRLGAAVAGSGIAARFGGDEFTVLLEGAVSSDEIRDIGMRIVKAFQSPLPVDGRELIVGVSVGASIYPEHEREAESLLKAADAALFRAKKLGRSQLAVFTSDLLETAASNFTTEQGLRRAIERGEFELLFQPEVDAESLQTRLVEALIRWRTPDGRLIPPGDFLAVAEESGMIVEISEWVLRTAVQCAARWHHGSWPDVRVAINISPRQLLEPAFAARLHGLLDECRLPARCIELELTESVLQTGPTTLRALKQLQELGVAIALDDFGTGYSSLSSLQQLPLSRVKLDRSLIQDMDGNARSRSMVRAIIGMCQELGLEITAEGVERAEQFALLVDYPSLFMQGYLLSAPVAESELDAARGCTTERAQELVLTLPSEPGPKARDLPAAGSRRARRTKSD